MTHQERCKQIKESDLEPTGIIATYAQQKEIAEMVEQANDTPVICFGSGLDAASFAWSQVHKFIDKCAKANGLPNMRDFHYSYHQGTGEFHRPKGMAGKKK